jgi:hypothetical protein
MTRSMPQWAPRLARVRESACSWPRGAARRWCSIPQGCITLCPAGRAIAHFRCGGIGVIPPSVLP